MQLISYIEAIYLIIKNIYIIPDNTNEHTTYIICNNLEVTELIKFQNIESNTAKEDYINTVRGNKIVHPNKGWDSYCPSENIIRRE